MVKLRFVLLILYLLLSQKGISAIYFQKNPHDVSFVNFKAIQGYRLAKNVSRQFDVIYERDCAFRCLNTECASFNFANSSSVCETSTTDLYRSKKSLIQNENFSHFFIPNGCLSNPCQNNATCQPFYTTNSYACQCSDGVYGQFCEYKYSPLGMEDGRINNGQITVSSYYSWGSNRFDGGQARLNNMKYPGAWEPTDSNPWIQVDFLDQKTVGAIATQGWGRTGNIRENSHVKTFKLSWSVDGIVWINYKEDGIEKVFNGNFDGNTIATNFIKNPFTSRFVRIFPLDYLIRLRMRMEFYGY